MTYTIQINEHQRVLIARAVRTALQSPSMYDLMKQPSDNLESSAWMDLLRIAQMLDEAPKHNEPELVHGFCL